MRAYKLEYLALRASSWWYTRESMQSQIMDGCLVGWFYPPSIGAKLPVLPVNHWSREALSLGLFHNLPQPVLLALSECRFPIWALCHQASIAFRDCQPLLRRRYKSPSTAA
ncbi:hypothetical protein PGTUg99_002092 [Puccinia graminis f. sp. tritici]|uniref:Uncharacterized protein n=1 Tax=Puccinia graminis f. sp. tritici TaxID=56615 RepID=A0A5B0RYB7_PUCGR|nr:hypothetical protein PGTUg99_002092 [Puccinia graminis f. sp. tritici]